MINRLRLENFKGIKEGELELAPLTILLGANNSGKTTILEALFLAPNPFREVPYGKNMKAVEVVREIHKTLNSEGFAFLLNKYISKKAEIGCEVNGDTHLLQFIKEGSWIYVSTNKGGPFTIKINGKEISYFGLLGLSGSGMGGSTELFKELFIDNTLLISSNLIKVGYEYLNYNWAFITNLGICGKVAREVSTLSSEKYNNITIEPFLGGSIAINALLDDEYGSRIRLGDLGEGIQNYIVARILYEVAKPKILLWDDVEAHFNPRILLKIAEWFSDLIKDGVQIVLTTHSLEAARTIAGLNEKVARIYLTSLDDGLLKAKALTLGEVEELLEAGIDVRVAGPFLL